MKFAKSLLFLITFITAYAANAAFIAEPFVSYQQFKAKNADAKRVTTNYGLRLGAGMGVWSFGGEYQAGQGKLEWDDNLFADDDVEAVTDLGAYLQYETKNGFRAYGVYYFSHELEEKDTTLNSTDEYEGDGGFKVAVGYRFANHFALNLEYIERKYEKDLTTPADINAKLKGYAIALSFPFKSGK